MRQGVKISVSLRRREVISTLESISPSSVHSSDLLFVLLLLLLSYHMLSTLCSISMHNSGATGSTKQTFGLGKHDLKGGNPSPIAENSSQKELIFPSLLISHARWPSGVIQREDEIFILLSPFSCVFLCVIILFVSSSRVSVGARWCGSRRKTWHVPTGTHRPSAVVKSE